MPTTIKLSVQNMLDSGYVTAEEMKSLLGLKSKSGDNRTLNKYVLKGKLEVKAFSRKVRMYKELEEEKSEIQNVDDWIF